MVSADYEKKLCVLRLAIEEADGSPFSIEPELEALLDEGVPSLARDLLMSLSDNAHSGAMYALVHEVERLHDNSAGCYTMTVLSILPDLTTTAPNWALNVIRRIMNTDDAFGELLKQVEVAPAPTKEAVRSISLLNDAIRPDYISETAKARLTLAAS